MAVSSSGTITNSVGLKEQRRKDRPIFSSGSRELVLGKLRLLPPDLQANSML
jgi:hypothetical protein